MYSHMSPVITNALRNFLYECWLLQTLKCVWEIGAENKEFRAKVGIQTVTTSRIG